MHNIRIAAFLIADPSSRDPCTLVDGRFVGNCVKSTFDLIPRSLGLNYTYVLPPGNIAGGIGTADENGQYGGLVGSIQRGEADIAALAVIVDDLPFEPGRIGAVVEAKEGVVLSRPPDPSTKTITVLHMFENFDAVTWFYISTAILILLGLLIGIDSNIVKRWRLDQRLLTKLKLNVWRVYSAITYQIVYRCKKVRIRTTWIAFVIGTFLVRTLLESLMSTDLTVPVKPAPIDHLRDLLKPEFANYTIQLMPQMQMFNAFSQAKSGSLYSRVYKYATRHGVEKAMFRTAIDQQGDSSLSLFTGDLAFVQTTFIMRHFVRTICNIAPMLFKYHYSNQKFDQLFYSYIYNQNLSSELSDLFDRKLKKIAEGDLYKVATDVELQRIIEKGVPMAANGMTAVNYACVARQNLDKTEVTVLVTLENLGSCFKFSAFLSISVVLIWMIEWIWYLFGPEEKKRKKIKRWRQSFGPIVNAQRARAVVALQNRLERPPEDPVRSLIARQRFSIV